MYFLRVANSDVSNVGIFLVLVFSFLKAAYSSASASICFWRVSISFSFCLRVSVWEVIMSGLIPFGIFFSSKVFLVYVSP